MLIYSLNHIPQCSGTSDKVASIAFIAIGEVVQIWESTGTISLQVSYRELVRVHVGCLDSASLSDDFCSSSFKRLFFVQLNVSPPTLLWEVAF